MDEINDLENVPLEGDEPQDHVLYEVGYLLIPTLAEEKISEVVGRIGKSIEDRNGRIVTSENPSMRGLAYTLEKHAPGVKKTTYDSAYFGWIKFELSPENAPLLKLDFDQESSIIRFLIARTVRVHTVPRKQPYRTLNRTTETLGAPVMSEAQIDKEVEDLLAASGGVAPVTLTADEIKNV